VSGQPKRTHSGSHGDAGTDCRVRLALAGHHAAEYTLFSIHNEFILDIDAGIWYKDRVKQKSISP
jgi:hypothetical protein